MIAKRFSRALVAATTVSLLLTSVAFADNLQNDVTVGGNDTISAGNSTIVTYRLVGNAAGGDINGCNVDASNAATLSITAPAGVTANPTSVQFTDCGHDGQKAVTFSSSTVGSHSITHSISGGKAGSIYTNQANLILKVNAVAVTNTPPQVSVTGPADEATYEFGSVPAAGCSVVDAEDTNESATPVVSAISGPLAAYGLGDQTVTCTYTDGGGLSASDSVTYTIQDTGAPVITNTLGATAGPTGANSWYIVPVTNTFTATDSGAGFLSPLTNPHNFTKSSGTAEGSAVKINSGTVTDVAGNVSLAIDSAAFKIDLSKPYNVQFSAFGSSFYFGSVPNAPTCSASDDISGVASCVVTGHSNAVGNHELTATATDHAGLQETAKLQYSVLAWTLSGFYSPVDMGIVNTVRGGSTVPLKFEIFAGSTELTSTSAIKSFTVTKTGCDPSAPTDDIEVYSTGGTSLRYDTTGGQFIQNWQTPKGAGACYRVVMTTQDLSTLVATFQTK